MRWLLDGVVELRMRQKGWRVRVEEGDMATGGPIARCRRALNARYTNEWYNIYLQCIFTAEREKPWVSCEAKESCAYRTESGYRDYSLAVYV